MLHCFNNTGQSCNAPSRMLVERSVYEQAVEVAGKVAQATAVGVASMAGPHIGPLVSAAQVRLEGGRVEITTRAHA